MTNILHLAVFVIFLAAAAFLLFAGAALVGAQAGHARLRRLSSARGS